MIKKILCLVFIFNSCSPFIISPYFLTSPDKKDFLSYDKTIDFSFYESFSFDKEKIENTSGVSGLDIIQIKDEIKENLRNKHILEIEKNPTMFVKVHPYVKKISAAYRDGFGYINTELVDYLFVVLDIKDAKTDKSIWRGEAKSPLPNNFMQRKIAPRGKVINVIINKILKKFPPSYLGKNKG